jgi:hypothetical protein
MAEGPKSHDYRLESVVSDSLIRIELITHFHRNPGLEGTSPELADLIGRDRSRVESQMKKLVQLHILDERLSNGELHYKYIPPHCIPMSGERKAQGRQGRIDAFEDHRKSAAESR